MLPIKKNAPFDTGRFFVGLFARSYCAVQPPSTVSAAPVIIVALSPQR